MSEKPQDIGIDSKSPLERDRIDLNHEISGQSTGRIQRFLSEDTHDIYGESKKKKSERHYRSMLQMLLAEDAQYAALYSQVSETLNNAYQAVGRALIDINQRLEDSGRKLQFLRENAAELQDGTKVFRSKDGNAYTEDGKRLNDEATQLIEFSDSVPSWEEYKAEKEAFDAATHQKAEVETYKHGVLDHAKERLEDKDDPALTDELKGLKGLIETMPDIVVANSLNKGLAASRVINTSLSAAHDTVDDTKLNTPDLNADFDLARVDIPDLGSALDAAPAQVRTLG